MKRILSLVFILLTMSVITFAEEMPKEVRVPSDRLSLSKNNEMLYGGKLYTGKVVFNGVGYDNGYMNLKDGQFRRENFY